MLSVRVGWTGQDPRRSCVLAVHGELDLDSAVRLRDTAFGALEAAGADPALVVVDCTGLAFCDSSGISCLIAVYQRLGSRTGALRLAAVPASVARVFDLTGLDQVIPVHATVREALAFAASAPGADGVRSPEGGTPSASPVASGR
ncbi:STAS domain-containing protein [Streptomyces sp. NPDC001941]|uniref:STAS domain-containing protein n=1 Tax=Streptomyces sp. NPDC001941 TaxID=3154659 RepID=UPI00331A3FF2